MPASTSVSLDIYETLKKKIINFELMPGQLLMVQQLSKEMEISRTPVREAMVRLKEDGFVEEAPGRKFRVTGITESYIRDLYELRIMLETAAVRQSAGKITKAQINAFRALVKKMERAYNSNDRAALMDYDLDFHNNILSLFKNAIITEWMCRMRDHQQRIRYLTSGIAGRLSESLEEHAAFVDSLESGDYALAEAQLREHLVATLEDIENFRKSGSGIAALMIK